MKKILTVVLCLVCAFSVLSDNKKNDPWVEWRRGYELFLEGDKYLRRNQLEDALSAYKRSRDTYKRVLEANTGWNKNLINSKISACETQILKIEKRLRAGGRKTTSAQSSSMPKDSAPKYSPSAGATTTRTVVVDDEYKKKYFNLYIEVENLRKRLRSQEQAVKNIDVLLKEKRLADEKVAALQKNIESLRKQMAQPEKELQDIRKQLIVERLKNEQLVNARSSDSATIINLRNEVLNLNKELAEVQQKLKDSVESRKTLNNSIANLRNKISELNDTIEDNNKNAKKYADEIASLQKSLKDSKEEIKKLNNWLDASNRQKGINDKLAANIVAENRSLKNDNNSLLNKIRQLENNAKDHVAKIQDFKRNLNNLNNSIATLNSQKQSLEKELKASRELYVRQMNAEKLNKAELETLRAEQKKTSAALQSYISRNAELTAMLETKDSVSANYSRKLEALQKEIEAKNKEIANLNLAVANSEAPAKKLAELTSRCEKLERELKNTRSANDKLAAENNALAAELRSSRNELSVFRSASATSATKNVSSVQASTNNQDYQKLLAAYNDLKNKYDFLSAEVESLNKPLADVGDSEPEINSDKELSSFLLKAAADAAKANDYISAAWYFNELKKQNSSNPLYIYGGALYETIASEPAKSVKLINSLADCKEKFILAGVAAMLDNNKTLASDNFKKASKTASVSKDVFALYQKDLQFIISILDKNNQMKDNISLLKELIK